MTPEVTAQLLDSKGRVLLIDTEYISTSAAGKVAVSWKSCNGWRYWLYQDPETLEWLYINELGARK